MTNPLDTALPCPFCGGNNLATPPGQAVVVCGDCNASGPLGTPHPHSDALTIVAGVSKWNLRAGGTPGDYGVCCVCGCTDEAACLIEGHPCSWWNEEHTLCSACAKTRHALDKLPKQDVQVAYGLVEQEFEQYGRDN